MRLHLAALPLLLVMWACGAQSPATGEPGMAVDTPTSSPSVSYTGGGIEVSASPSTTGSTTADPSTSESATADPSTSESDDSVPYTCKSLRKEVIKISKTAKGDQPEILSIYRPKTIKDHQRDFIDGHYAVPKGKVQVKVLTCKGIAAWGDGTESEVHYYVSVDRDWESFAGYSGD